MVSIHGVKLTPPEESLAQAERLLRETPRTDANARLILHLEGRVETLKKIMAKGGYACTGSKDSDSKPV